MTGCIICAPSGLGSGFDPPPPPAAPPTQLRGEPPGGKTMHILHSLGVFQPVYRHFSGSMHIFFLFLFFVYIMQKQTIANSGVPV